MGLRMKEASHNRAKADALTLVGRPSPSWSELYLIFELVEANVGGRMFADGWIGRTEANLFTRTANSYTALGMAGRHGKDRGDPYAISRRRVVTRQRRNHAPRMTAGPSIERIATSTLRALASAAHVERYTS